MCFPSYVLPFSFFISLVRSAIFDGFLFLLVLPFSLVSPALLSDANPLSLALLPLLLIPRYCFCVVFIMILSLANVCLLHSFIKFYVVDVIVVGTSQTYSYFNVVVWMNTMGKREVRSLFVCSFGWILGIPTILLSLIVRAIICPIHQQVIYFG